MNSSISLQTATFTDHGCLTTMATEMEATSDGVRSSICIYLLHVYCSLFGMATVDFSAMNRCQLHLSNYLSAPVSFLSMQRHADECHAASCRRIPCRRKAMDAYVPLTKLTALMGSDALMKSNAKMQLISPLASSHPQLSTFVWQEIESNCADLDVCTQESASAPTPCMYDIAVFF